MKSVDAVLLRQHGEGGGFLKSRVWSRGWRKGDAPNMGVHVDYSLVPDPRDANRYRRADAERFISQPRDGVEVKNLVVVVAPMCGCCGDEQVEAPQHAGRLPPVWRCPKHIGRLPCLIEGCGRTFAMKGDDGYDTTVICGSHWRQAPIRIRRQCAAIRKKAYRIGWTENLTRLYHFAWNRGLRAIREGHGPRLDMTDINKMFGWDDDTTAAKD